MTEATVPVTLKLPPSTVQGLRAYATKQWPDHRGDRDTRARCLSELLSEGMAERRARRGALQVHLDYAFDRLRESKLAQAYEMLVPARERLVADA